VRTTKFRGKPIFLVLCVKKDKIMSHVKPYFSTEFCFLPSPHEKLVLMKQLGSHIGCEEVHATFFFEFFDGSKYI
jgi:hypothetical protein